MQNSFSSKEIHLLQTIKGLNLILVEEDIKDSMNQISKDEFSTHAHGSISTVVKNNFLKF